ncbi:carbohydrate ABC transporter permease [Leadbettera azotonutricia]|uniref:Multiple sugar-binding transport system permease n=1 Tax=Leadbettera azotonutricia (strain ATCC BAA-888 / DSM 13862 / ZAS-9) TaxID=545695 RepID=F5Y7Z1_LEAAZ|nr:sugar ABC transporter permease [Leadbettera azotonutricia]AEF82155.1 multiple sugar-binding transport system permease [Leadbettera azotonutricia ZAS-9]
MNIYKKWFWPFVMPALILFFFVIIIPFMVGIFDSLVIWRGSYYFDPVTRTRAASPLDAFVGFQNYINAFKEERFRRAFIYTLQYTVIAVIVHNAAALCLALLVTNIASHAASAFRTTFFMPNMLGGLALGFIWQFIFQIVFTDILFGPGGLIHIEALRYMTQSSVKAIFALVLLTTWQSAGYMMIIYVAGLNNIPKDFYEAASIDGASSMRVFRKITVPMLMPSFTIVFFMTISGSFKLLDQNVALTDGEFNTRMLAYQILRTVRDSNPPDYGKAQAQAVIFFVVVAAITLTQTYLTKKKELEA